MESLAIKKEVKNCVWRAANHIHILAEFIRLECQMLYTQCHSPRLMVARVFPIFYSPFHFWQWPTTRLSKQFSSHKLSFWEKWSSTLDSSFSPVQLFCFCFWRVRRDRDVRCWDLFPSHGYIDIDFSTLLIYSWRYEQMRAAASEYLKNQLTKQKTS